MSCVCALCSFEAPFEGVRNIFILASWCLIRTVACAKTPAQTEKPVALDKVEPTRVQEPKGLYEV